MPTGHVFYTYGPLPRLFSFLCYIDCLIMICYPCCLNTACHLDASKIVYSFNMTSTDRLGSLSAPPRPQPSTTFTIRINGPLPEELLNAQAPVLHPLPPLPPQPVYVEAAAPDGFEDDDTLEYWIEEADPVIASNAVVRVDATTQYSRLSSRPGSAAASPRPIIGLHISGAIEAIITGETPVYAPRQQRRSARVPSPPPLYADSAPRVVRRPPPALLVQRPRTRSSSGDEPLFEPLISDTRYFL